MRRTFTLWVMLALAGSVAAAAQSPADRGTATTNDVLSPEAYLGYEVGTDFRLAPWDTILGYFTQLADNSPYLQLDTLGSTTLGEAFVLATITAPRNFARIGAIQARQARLADPRRLSDDELDELLDTQPAVIYIANNLHSTEIASSQGSMELAHALITDPALTRLLDDLVILLVPSANPDGQTMVVDWYGRTMGTPYEGAALPWLYHHYAGHDNNRDWFMLNLVETRLVTDLLYWRWFPEIVYDVHQMGNRGARFFVPPFDDPVNPNLDPLLIRMISLFGIKISTDLEAASKSGVVNYRTYDLWWHGGNRSVPTRHNMVGLLSETASARYASPIFQEPGQLSDEPQLGVHYPNPWPGGWWRMRDIVDYQLIAARSVIGFAAGHRRELISNFVEVGRRSIAAGADEPPYAYVIPSQQTDPGSAARMLEILRLGGVEVHQAKSGFEVDGIQHPAGAWVVLMAQPYRAHAKDLLERQEYPDRRLYDGGPPDRPYDVSGWTLPLQMGVEAIAVRSRFEAELELLTDTIRPAPGEVHGNASAYAVDYTHNAASLAIHETMARGGEAGFLSEALEADGRSWPAGTVILKGSGLRETLVALATREGLDSYAISGAAEGFRLKDFRVGLYQSWTARMDEGWTRFVFDEWDLPYRSLHDPEIRAGGLDERYDVIIIPDMSRLQAVEGRGEGTVPAEYAGGLGAEGVDALLTFVERGGTLVCLGAASNLAIEEFELPIQNVRPDDAEQRAGTAFYAPGSVLKVNLDPDHPLAYGMPAQTGVYYSNGPIFEVAGGASGVDVVAQYSAGTQLLSGYALHSASIAGKAALVEAQLGAGRVILFGFRPQHRGQPHETFKLLFNAIYRGSVAGPERLEF